MECQDGIFVSNCLSVVLLMRAYREGTVIVKSDLILTKRYIASPVQARSLLLLGGLSYLKLPVEHPPRSTSCMSTLLYALRSKQELD